MSYLDTLLSRYPPGTIRAFGDCPRPRPTNKKQGAHMATEKLNGSAQPALRNDPLAGMTPWKLYQRCIWASDESSYVKVMLLCISRYMDKNLRAASMSYSKIARDCGFSAETAKKTAKKIAGTWLRIGVGKGRYVPGKGNENAYDGIIPEKWTDEVRRQISAGNESEPDEEITKAVDKAMTAGNEVSHRHPGDEFEVSNGHPAADFGVSDRPGCPTDTSNSGCPTDRGVQETQPGCLTDLGLPELPEKKNNTLSSAGADGACATEDPNGKAVPPVKAGTRKPSFAEQTRKRAAPKATEEQFARFWPAYPIRDGKAKARENFLKLTQADAELAIFGAGQFAAKVAIEREQRAKRGEELRIKWAQGWLTERRFVDYEEAFGAAHGVAADDPEAEVARMLASPDGQSLIGEHGPEKAEQMVRDIVTGKGATNA